MGESVHHLLSPNEKCLSSHLAAYTILGVDVLLLEPLQSLGGSGTLAPDVSLKLAVGLSFSVSAWLEGAVKKP